MPEEDQNSSIPPTWADFKPPVLTTPFGATSGSSPVPADATNPDVPISPPVETVPDATPSQTWVETPPVSVEPVVSYQVVQENPAPSAVPVEANPVLSDEPQITKQPLQTTEPAVMPDQAPQLPAEPTQPSSRYDNDFPSLVAGAVPEGVTSAESAPVAPAAALEVVPVPNIVPVPDVSETKPSNTPPPQVTKSSSSPVQKKAIVIVGLIILLSASAGGFYIWNNPPARSPEVASPKSVENTAILADSESASSWENNYSTTLLASERGGLEFLATDPPATGSANPQSAKVELISLKVKVAKVDLHLATQSVVASGVSPESTKSANKAIDRWETLRLNANTTIDLMDLRNKGGALSSLGITYLAAGRYTEIRLFITKATGITKDGTSIDIEIPGKTGLIKLVKPFNISTTGTLKLIVDFDAPSMVIKSGDTYQLRPVVAKVIYNDLEI